MGNAQRIGTLIRKADLLESAGFMSSPLDMRCIINRFHVKGSSGATVFVAFDLTPSQATKIYPKNLNVSLAIDCSSSMIGEKMDDAIDSAVALSRQLNPTDLISLVSFESRTKVELPATKASDPSAIEAAIRRLSAEGSTDMYSGIEISYKETLKNSKSSGTISRLILLTDGEPTEGKTNDRDFVQLAQKIRGDGITVSTLGIGDDYNDSLLTKIAQAGGGLWYHIKDPSKDLPEFLKEQVTEMASTVVMSPELKFWLMPGADLLGIYAVRPMLTQLARPIATRNTYSIPLRDLIAGEQQNLVLRIRIPPRQAGLYRLIRAELQSVAKDVTITYTDDPNLYGVEANPYPRILLTLAEGTLLMRKGVATKDQAAVQQADTILRTVSADPNLDTAVHTNPVVQDVVTVLRDTHATVLKGKITESDRKQMMQNTTIIGKKRQH